MSQEEDPQSPLDRVRRLEEQDTPRRGDASRRYSIDRDRARRQRRRSGSRREANRWSGRCFRCNESGHYERDCWMDPDPEFPGWRYWSNPRDRRGYSPLPGPQPSVGGRSARGPRGLGAGTVVWPWTPYRDIHPLVIQCYHCYQYWHRQLDYLEEPQVRQSRESGPMPDTPEAEGPPSSSA
jgi:hypothetical protein